MLSRVAASFYWLSRYIERSDGMLRMLKINYASSQDTVQEFTWEPVIRIFASPDEEGTEKIENNSRAVLKYMVTGKNNSNSILNIITHAPRKMRAGCRTPISLKSLLAMPERILSYRKRSEAGESFTA